MFEADITKVVEEMAVHIRETEEEFILDTIFPYCQETLQRKINKAELKQIIIRGSRPNGNWTYIGNSEVNGLKICECSVCEKRTYGSLKYCPNCGAEMEEGVEDGDNN